MYRCNECDEESVSAYYDSYDDEVYMRCRTCGKSMKRPACRLCGETLNEGESAFAIEKDIYCTDCVECITV